MQQEVPSEAAKSQLPTVPAAKPVEINYTHFNLNGKTYKLRLESPRTLRACKDLGIELDYLLDQKTLADFRDKNKEITDMKYTHYQNRMQQSVKDIIQQRRQIVRSALGKQLVKEQEQNDITMQSEMPSRLKDLNKNLSVLRNTSYDNKPMSFIDVVDDQDQNFFNNRFQNQIDQEISRYNKQKLQKQRIAKEILQQQEKNQQTSFKMLQKQDNYNTLTQQQESQLRKEQEAKRKFYRMRQDKIHRLKEKNFKGQQDFGQRLQERQERAVESAFNLSRYNPEDQVNNSKFSHSTNKLIRDQIVSSKKAAMEEEQSEREMDIIASLAERMQVSKNHTDSLQEMREIKIQQKHQEINDKYNRTQQIKQQKEEDKFQQIVSRMNAQNKNIEQLNKQIAEKERQRKKKENEKLKKNSKQQDDIERQWREKSRKIEQRQRQVEEKLKEQKEEREWQMVVANEKKKLQEIDKKLNYERELNKNKFRHQMILERQQRVSENMNLMKQQQQMVLETRKQLNRKLAEEDSKVNQSLSQLGEIFNATGRAKSLSVAQVKQGNQIIHDMLNQQVGYTQGMFHIPKQKDPWPLA